MGKSKVDFMRENQLVLSISVHHILKYGFSENRSYLEISEGGSELLGGSGEFDNVSSNLVELASGSILLWIEFDHGEDAEEFCGEISKWVYYNSCLTP